MKKGFTILEVIIATALLGIVLSFFSSVYQYGYKLGIKSRLDITMSYKGQEDVESAIAKTIGYAQEYKDKVLSLPSGASPPTGVLLPDLSFKLWNTDLRGYSVREVISDKTGSTQLQADIFSFVYPNARKPAIPEAQFVHEQNNKYVPLFQYNEEIKLQQAKKTDKDKDYHHKIQYGANVKDVIRRVVVREYIGSKSKKLENDTYISRPYTMPLSSDYENLVPYSSAFPIGFEYLAGSSGKVLFDSDGGQLGIPGEDLKIAYPFNLSYDSQTSEKYRDIQLLTTIQAQTVNGYTEQEKIIPGTETWIIGVPVINGLVGHWDANLIFKDWNINYQGRKTIPYTENTQMKILNDNISSYTTTINSVNELIEEPVPPIPPNSPTNNLSKTSLKTQGRFVDLHFKGASLSPKLLVKHENGNRSALYRRFSAGIELKGENNRLNLSVAGKTAGFKDGKSSYTVVIRAKIVDKTKEANLFSINMNENHAINNITHQNYEANQVSVIGDIVNYYYDKGTNNPDTDSSNPRKVHTTFPDPIPSSLYEKVLVDNEDERSGYHIFELELESIGEDAYKIALIVDGTKAYRLTKNTYNWCDIEEFGLDIGSNLEVSDLLVYDKNLSDQESKDLATYLINKYIY